jgi:hypothetical protein
MWPVPLRSKQGEGCVLVVRAPNKTAILSIILAASQGWISGCGPAGSLERIGVAIAPPSTWRPVKPLTWSVPGTALAAWAGPDGSSLVLYRALPVPGGTAAMIAEALGNRLENLPGLRLVVKRTEKVAGTTAVRVEVVAPGFGDAMAPSGTGSPIALDGKVLVPTRQVTLGFVRPAETLYLTWHVPESSHARIGPQIDATLESLRFTSSGTPATYRY